MNSKTFSILFYIKKRKSTKIKDNQNASDKQSIYIRITVNGCRSEFSANRKCDPDKWNVHGGRAIGTKEEFKILNSYLDTINFKLYEIYRQLIEAGKPLSAELIKNIFLGREIDKPKLLIEIIQEHNDRIKTLIGHDYMRATWVKYNTTQKHLADFVLWKYNKADINIKDLNFSFISDFEYFLKVTKNIDVNTNAKYIKNLKKIIRDCICKNWLTKDPFIAYKIKSKRTERDFLNESEIRKIESKCFSIERLDTVRDLFLFSCYTGLAYVDVANLTPANIVIGNDGEKWIYTVRQKTDIPSRIPLLPKAIEIIDKYLNENKIYAALFPVPSNQKLNAYLKEIADCCEISKRLTFHIARHTFATTVTLNNGVSIESVSKMLGHKKLQTTQHYAKILDKKVSQDMQALKQKLLNLI